MLMGFWIVMMWLLLQKTTFTNTYLKKYLYGEMVYQWVYCNEKAFDSTYQEDMESMINNR